MERFTAGGTASMRASEQPSFDRLRDMHTGETRLAAPSAALLPGWSARLALPRAREVAWLERIVVVSAMPNRLKHETGNGHRSRHTSAGRRRLALPARAVGLPSAAGIVAM